MRFCRASAPRRLVVAMLAALAGLAAARPAAAGPGDVDNDGLPDVWEVAHFGNIASQDQFGDPDGDGASNAQEFAGGTDPLVYDGPSAPVPVAPACGGELGAFSATRIVRPLSL